MSTRCHIRVQGNPVLIYKHSDGYPDGVLPTLKEVTGYFLDHRGWDPDYLLAQIVRWFGHLEFEEKYPGDDPEFAERMHHHHRTLGWGLGTEEHGDIEYSYTVTPKCIKVLEVYTGKVSRHHIPHPGPYRPSVYSRG